MSALHTEALLLRAHDFGESDRVLHLLTPAAGRIAVVASGARRSAKRFGGTLDYFNLLHVQIESRPSRRGGARLARLEAARLRRAFLGLRACPRRFALAGYALELLGRLAPEGGAPAESAKLFAFAKTELARLENAAPTAHARMQLELRALAALGLRPQLLRCVRCENNLQEAQTPLAFRVAEGGPVCARCLRVRGAAAAAGLPVHLSTLRALHSAMVSPQETPAPLAGSAAAEAAAMLRAFLRFHAGLEFRSETLLSALFANPPPPARQAAV